LQVQGVFANALSVLRNRGQNAVRWCISIRCKIAVSAAQQALHPAGAENAEPVLVRSTTTGGAPPPPHLDHQDDTFPPHRTTAGAFGGRVTREEPPTDGRRAEAADASVVAAAPHRSSCSPADAVVVMDEMTSHAAPCAMLYDGVGTAAAAAASATATSAADAASPPRRGAKVVLPQ